MKVCCWHFFRFPDIFDGMYSVLSLCGGEWSVLLSDRRPNALFYGLKWLLTSTLGLSKVCFMAAGFWLLSLKRLSTKLALASFSDPAL